MGGHATIHGASTAETRTGGGIKWVPVSANSDGSVATADGFKASSYNVNLNVTVAGTAVSMDLASGVELGAGRIHVTNLGATTENMRLAFGTDQADAVSNLTVSGGIGTTGLIIVPVVDGGQPQVLKVPALAAAVACVNGVASDTPELAIVQGV